MPEHHRRKLVIADDHEFIVGKVIEMVADEFAILATLNDGAQVAETVDSLRPDIVLLDISMPCIDGLTAAREVRRMGLPVKIVFLTADEDADLVRAAMALGASYVLKCRMHIDLLVALNETLAGRMYVSPFSTPFQEQNKLSPIGTFPFGPIEAARQTLWILSLPRPAAVLFLVWRGAETVFAFSCQHLGARSLTT